MEVNAEGLPEVVSELTGLAQDMADLRGAFTDIAARGERLAKALAPKRTGRLATSVHGRAGANQAEVSGGGLQARYFRYVHGGTRYQRSQPFLFQTADRLTPVAESILEQHVEAAIARRGF